MVDEVVMETPGEAMSLAEIRRRYPDRFVLLSPPDVEDMKLRGGVVRAHGRDRAALRRVLMALPEPRVFAMFWSGSRMSPHGWVSDRVDRSA